MIISPLENTAIKYMGLYWKQKRPFITQEFGLNPEVYGRFGLDGHNGTDFRCKVGTPIYAPIDGKVKVKDSKSKGYGLHVKIRGGDREVVLAHLSSVLVKDGDTLRLGQKIGYSGNTGFSTGPHLHFGFRNIIVDRKVKDIFKWKVKNYDNGYMGYWDVMPYTLTFKGTFREYSIN